MIDCSRKIKTSLLITLISSALLTGCVPVLLAGAGGTGMMFAKDRDPSVTVSDFKIASSIKTTLISKGFRELYVKINVEVFAGRVLLTGRLETEREMNDVLDIVHAQNGVLDVINEIQITNEKIAFNATQYARDSLITSQIKSKFLMNRDIKTINYIVVTNYDIVYLFGIARSEEELNMAASIAANINGVKKVVSHVIVDSSIAKRRNSSNHTNSQDEEISVKDISDELSKY